MNLSLPNANAVLIDANGRTTREYYTFFRSLVSNLQDINVGPVDPDEGKYVSADASVRGIGSLQSFGTLAGGLVSLSLFNDIDSPGNTSYYGSNGLGQKGWYAISSSLSVTPNLTQSIGDDGISTFDLADLADSGEGSFELITRDPKGRVSGTKSGSTTDVPEGENLYFTVERAAAAAPVQEAPEDGGQYARKNGSWSSVVGYSYSDLKAALVQGANITLMADDAAQTITITSTGSSGGVGVATVTNGAGISVDNTDPDNPVVALSSTSQASLVKADSALQPGDNVSQLNNDAGYVESSSLAAVATSGSYSDLSNTPTIPAAQVNSDWNATSGVASILNKPALGTAASTDASAYATAAQGAEADTALQSVQAGANIAVDNTDPRNPVVSSPALNYYESDTAPTAADYNRQSLIGGLAWRRTTDGYLFVLTSDGSWLSVDTSGMASWGQITGTLSNQTDLEAALNGKEPSIASGTTAQFWRGDKVWSNEIRGPLIFRSDLANNEFHQATTTASVSSLSIGGQAFYGANGTADALGGTFNFRANQAWTASANGCDFAIRLITTGTTTLAERFRVRGDGAMVPGSDNTQTCGNPSLRWSTYYGGTTAISSSDARLKTEVTKFTDDELACALQLADEIGWFKWLSSIEEKGDAARKHVGMTVQRAMEIMKSHKMDPLSWGFICYDKWQEEPEAYESWGQEKDTEGNIIREAGRRLITPYRPAGDLYSFRETALQSFISAGIRQQQLNLEERLQKLEESQNGTPA